MPPAPDPDIFGRPLWAEKTNAWALELERGGMDEQRKKKAWVKKGESLSPYKGSRNPAPPHLPRKLAYPPSAMIKGAVGLPTPVLMRIP